MKVIIDRDKLKRRAGLSHAASLGGLLILLGSVAISLWKPGWTTLQAIMLFGGFSISVVGIYYANRWAKKPRPEDILDQALKGFSDHYRIYHYLLPCDHLFLTPNGVVVIETCNLEGVFIYQGGKWRQKLSISRAMRFFVEEKLGDPIQRAQDYARWLKKHLEKDLPEGVNIPVNAMVVFTNPYAEIKVENAAIPVCLPKNLKNRIPKGSSKLTEDVYQQVRMKIEQMADYRAEGKSGTP